MRTSSPSKFKQKEGLRICLTAENEGRYTVQDMNLAFLIFHPLF